MSCLYFLSCYGDMICFSVYALHLVLVNYWLISLECGFEGFSYGSFEIATLVKVWALLNNGFLVWVSRKGHKSSSPFRCVCGGS